jgi:SAM-dependent methyltransferase
MTHERAQHDEENNVTYQRCQYAYEFAIPYITGKKVLDVGCGRGYGTELMSRYAQFITGLDYDQFTVDDNTRRLKDIPNISFIRAAIPPLPLEDNSVDVITAFQFIEHIGPRREFLQECMRVLRPGGKFLVTTPNIKKSFAPNPFHVHEYTFDEMKAEVTSVGAGFELKGLNGNRKVNKYYDANGRFVRNILRWDVLGLHKRIPSAVLAQPYNWITNRMRKQLKSEVSETSDITTSDFFLQNENLDDCWDIYLIGEKN